MDSPVELLGLSAAMVALAATLLLILGLRARTRLYGRIARLEDALRVYNSANAEIGRQLRAMEERLLLAATTPLSPRGVEAVPARATDTPSHAERIPVPRGLAGLAPLRTSESLVARPGVGNPVRGAIASGKDEGDSGGGAAERRLAELIRARLPAARALQ
jgi:hypothetical protein